jgi:hypothetical protein
MTAPIYDPNIPENASSNIAQGQIDFLDNFMALFNAFQINHVPLNAASGAGNHTIIQLPEQTGQFQTDVGEISVYSREVDGQGVQLFLRYQGNQQEFQLSNYQIYAIPNQPNVITQYFSILPGRIIVYFGVFAAPAAIGNQLNLFPAIAKNIITMNFCPLIAASLPPIVTIQTPVNGIYKTINLHNAATGIGQYYIVLANI